MLNSNAEGMSIGQYQLVLWSCSLKMVFFKALYSKSSPATNSGSPENELRFCHGSFCSSIELGGL